MKPHLNQVAVVTGGTAGIGRAVAIRLAQEGMHVFVTGRKMERMRDVEECREAQGRVYAFPCDMATELDLIHFFRVVKERFNAVHVLVNNATTVLYTKVADCQLDKWKKMFDVNVFGAGIATRETLKIMCAASIYDGYIINITGTAAHGIPVMTGKHVYNATKHALRVITEGLRAEFAEVGARIRVSMISPGSVTNEVGAVGGWLAVCRAGMPVPTLKSEDIADAVLYLINLPPKVQISDMIVRPTGETVLH